MTKKAKELQIPKLREKETKPHKQGVTYTPEGIFKNTSYRRCPACHSKGVKRNGKSRRFGKYRYQCNSCSKHFVININAIDIERLFTDTYDIRYAEKPYMLNTKYRKVRAFTDNKEVRKEFNKIIAEYNTDKGFSDDERDEYAFYAACELADRIDAQEIEKHLDSWYYLLNQYDMDVTYHTKHNNWILARQHDIKLSRRQNIKSPLLHCASCGSSDISTDGFNNNARRRIRCNTCSKKSLIRVNNIVKESDAYAFFRNYLQEFTRKDNLIEEITEKMVANFRLISISKHFDTLLAGQKIITHQTKKEILQASIGVQILMKFRRAGVYDAVLNSLDLPENLNLFGQVKHEDTKTIGFMKPKIIDQLQSIEPVLHQEDVALNHMFYQAAAVMHEPDFYNWEKNLEESFDLAKEYSP